MPAARDIGRGCRKLNSEIPQVYAGDRTARAGEQKRRKFTGRRSAASYLSKLPRVAQQTHAASSVPSSAASLHQGRAASDFQSLIAASATVLGAASSYHAVRRKSSIWMPAASWKTSAARYSFVCIRSGRKFHR